MTRDFNKPKRDDSRPAFRNASPNRNRDERSPRPARPRLNRETVDRAWESGAQQQHADYHPRSSGGQYGRPQGQGQQRNSGWRNPSNNQQSGYSSQNERGGSRPYNSRPDNYRDNRQGPGNYRDDRDSRDTRDTRDAPRNFDRPYQPSNTPNRPMSGPPRRDFGGPRPADRRDSFNGAPRREGDTRPPFQDRGNQRRDVGRPDRPPTRNTYGDRTQREAPAPSPRWQTRPSEQRNIIARGPERTTERRPSEGRERFEGDYERFEERPARPNDRPFSGNRDAQSRPAKPFGGKHDAQSRPDRPFDGSRGPQGRPDRHSEDKNEVQPERHVTRLPDGRVLKGPRPVQRREAQFWTDVTENTSELMSRVTDKKVGDTDTNSQENLTDANVTVPALPQTELLTIDNMDAVDALAILPDEVFAEEASAEIGEASSTEEAPKKRRPRVASAVARTKKPRSSGPKPSQRGFKWPAPTQDAPAQE